MIIVFADDQTVEVLPDIGSVRAECEAVDVESGAFQFFDEFGRGLRPRFVTPVSRTPLLFGIGLVSGGNFELDLDERDDGSAFATALANAVVIEPNPWFTTLEDLASFVTENWKRAKP